MKLITVKWLEEKNACGEAVRKYTSWLNGGKPLVECIEKLERADWLLWLLWHCEAVTHPQLVKLACLCARKTLYIYEKRYPDDMRPRRAIEAAEAWSDDPTDENKVLVTTVHDAADAADTAAYAVYVVADVRAAHAAYAASCTVDAVYSTCVAATVATAAADAANAAIDAAAYAADAAAGKKLHTEMCAEIVEKFKSLECSVRA